MPKTPKKAPSADAIAEMASRGENVSAYFSNKFTVIRPIRRVNVVIKTLRPRKTA